MTKDLTISNNNKKKSKYIELGTWNKGKCPCCGSNDKALIARIVKKLKGMKIENTAEGLDLDKDWDMKTMMVREGHNQALSDAIQAIKNIEEK